MCVRRALKHGTCSTHSLSCFLTGGLLVYLEKDNGISDKDDCQWHEIHGDHAEDDVGRLRGFVGEGPEGDTLAVPRVVGVVGNVEYQGLQMVNFVKSTNRPGMCLTLYLWAGADYADNPSN